MASLMGAFNRLLPFATPGTPVIQDVLHVGAICILLYYAPQIQEWLQSRKQEDNNAEPILEEPHEQHDEPAGHREVEHDVGDREQEAFEQEADLQDGGPDNDDFREFQQQQQAEDGAGPANGPRVAPDQRNVGAKKAKSLARKDQRRAYHEFQRAQGEAQRARDAEGATEREAAQAAERERRKAAEAKLEAKKAKEREEKKEQERKEREENIARRELAVKMVRKELDANRKSNLFDVARQIGGDADEVWMEKLLNASGLLGMNAATQTLTFVTSTAWIVRVNRDDMMRVYESAADEGAGDENGKVGYEEIARILERVLT